MQNLIVVIDKLNQALIYAQSNEKVKNSVTETLEIAITELYRFVEDKNLKTSFGV